MPSNSRLPRSFYNRPTLQVARELIGTRLVFEKDGQRLGGIITETEAYCGEEDLACHAKAGRTPRTSVMYGPPGHAFVYFTYGNHWMFCPVTCEEDEPEAVLIRAIAPTMGLDVIEARRGNRPRPRWTDGPGKLTQALGINGGHNTLDLTAPDAALYIEKGIHIPKERVTISPRIGLNKTLEPWFSKPWRFLADVENIAIGA